ncbi:MAG: hypothetical protein JWR84_1420 [Caulobacter sp.]|nr:hypothetical protein [Caulobacter sp.]
MIDRRLALGGLGGLAAMAATPALAVDPKRRPPPKPPQPQPLPLGVTRGLPWTSVQIGDAAARPFGLNLANHEWYAHPSVFDPAYKPGAADAERKLKLDRVLIGGRLIDADVTCWSWPQAFEGQPVAGWIGLERYDPLLLDWDRRVMTVNAMPPEGWPTLPFNRQVDTHSVIDVTLDGAPCRLALGSFYSWGLELSEDYVQARGLWDRYPRRRDNHDADGRLTHQSVVMERLDIAGLTFDAPVARLNAGKPTPRLGGYRSDGVIGYDLLRRFNLHVDHRKTGTRGIAVAYSRQKDDPWADDRAGIAFKAYGNELQVGRLDETGPAFQSGVRLGDIVIDAEVEGGAEGLAYALTRPAGTQVPLDILRGEKRLRIVVTLKDRL